jgi:hypothetical protein
MTPNIFASFRPDADDLLRRVSRHIDDVLLGEIAAADHGRDMEENLAFLQQIRDQELLPSPMPWYPREVLELIRWSEPEDPEWKPGLPGERGHWMRIFACSALLRAAGQPENKALLEGSNQTLIQLIDSLRAIAPELYGPAAAFLAWLIPQVAAYDDPEELGFLLVGLLWLALRLRATDDVVVALSELTAAEAERQRARHFGPRSTRWLLGATYHDLRHASWERLGRSLVEMDLSGRSSETSDWVRLIGSELAGG